MNMLAIESECLHRSCSGLSGLGLTHHWNVLPWVQKLVGAGTVDPEQKPS